jgi:hypothetical protein
MKPGLKRDIAVAVSMIVFVMWGLNVLRDWEVQRIRTFLKSNTWDNLPMSSNIETRGHETCVTLFDKCLPYSGNVGK